MKNPLAKLQRDTLTSFFEKPVSKVYFLTGGTALAGFYLFHRESIDLDLFTFEIINTAVIEQTLQIIAQQTQIILAYFSQLSFFKPCYTRGLT